MWDTSGYYLSLLVRGPEFATPKYSFCDINIPAWVCLKKQSLRKNLDTPQSYHFTCLKEFRWKNLLQEETRKHMHLRIFELSVAEKEYSSKPLLFIYFLIFWTPLCVPFFWWPKTKLFIIPLWTAYVVLKP